MTESISQLNLNPFFKIKNNQISPKNYVGEISNKKIEQNPTNTGALALSAYNIGGLNATDKFSKMQKTTPDIIFNEAKTLKEAVEFGQKNLGIKNYKGFKEKDLDIVNWVNEGLVNVHNKSQGKAHLPNNIIYSNTKELKLASAAMGRKENLYLSKRLFEPLKEKYKIIEQNNNTKNKNQDLHDSNLFKRAMQYVSKEETYSFTTSPFNIIYHEIGHLQHQKNIDADLYDSLDLAEERPKKLSNKAKELINLFENSKQVASKVSKYAQTSAIEFVAECHSKIFSGIKLDCNEMQLFKALGGADILI